MKTRNFHRLNYLLGICALTCNASNSVGQSVVGSGAPARLPITAVTLFRSGVGYFERVGSVKAGDSVQLRFANDEINDMLKSMVILDPEQALQVVSFESKEPLARQLASFGVDLSDNPTLGTILGRLRGANVRFVTNDGPVDGTILGGEMREQAQGNAQKAIAIPFVNVVTVTGVRSVNLTTAVSVQLENDALNAELMKALSALAAHSTDRFKTVDLSFAGKGAREVAVSYVNEMPIWKTSYRLVLPSDQVASEKPLLQGWAIVENTTDDDWSGVQLALVASQPVSFKMDLSESLHISRPMLPVPMVAGAAPRIYQDGDAFEAGTALRRRVAEAPPPPVSSAPASRAMKKAGDPMYATADSGGGSGGDAQHDAQHDGGSLFGAGGDDESEMEVSAEDRWRETAVSQAQAGSIGEAFQYSLKMPISIPRQQSAMLPILSSPIDGRRVSIFNRDDRIEHPMRGFELKNSTGLQLIPGPIAVFDAYTYAGDAQIGYLTLGDTRLIAYAVDLSVAAATTDADTNTLQSVKIVDGAIEMTNKSVMTTSYAFNNKDAVRGRTLLVESPKWEGWQLTAPEKPAQETSSLYRFEIDMKPSETATLVVAQERTNSQRTSIVGYDMPLLLSFSRDGKASAAVVEAVKKAANLQSMLIGTADRIARLRYERDSINEDQNRVRQNMNAIDHDTDIYRRYLARFSEQESRLETLRDEEAKESGTAIQQQKALEDYIRALAVE